MDATRFGPSLSEGVGDQLVKELIKDAIKVYKERGFKLRKLYLLTHANNKNAHKFYKRVGFKHETTLKEHYYRNKDEYVFSMFFNKTK